MRVAAIDIGTVTCRLLIADVDGSLRHAVPVVRRAEITDLGEGVDASGMLSPEAIDRTVAQVAEYKRCIDAYRNTETPVRAVVAVATSASRDAANAGDFVSRLSELGVELTVIDGQREAELSFAGAADDFPDEDILVTDIGGGSTEVIFGTAHAACAPGDAGCLAASGPSVTLGNRISFNVGCRRMTERFLRSDPPSVDELARARAWVREEMAPFFANLPAAQRLVAVAGTATTAVSIRERMAEYDPDRVHGACVTRDELQSIFLRLASMPLEERKGVVGLQPQRASVIVAGFVILDAVLELSGHSSFTVSEHDILQGLVLDAVSKAC